MMAPSGPKPKPKGKPRAALSADAPKEMKGRARQLYLKLSRDLIAEGYACQADARVVALAAKTEAHAERLENAVDALGELVVFSTGGQKIHPLVAELRAVRSQLANIYGALFLTPRARSSSRMTESMARAAATKSDDLEDFLNG